MNQLDNYIDDPQNPEYNFALGLWYEDQGHTAAAVSFYLRVPDFTEDALLQYESVLRMVLCFIRQEGHFHLVKGLLHHAIALKPERPEAYFLLCRLYEWDRQWQESYSIAAVGQALSDDHPPLRTNVDYPGKYGFVFERAVTAWWIGYYDESIYLFKELRKNKMMNTFHIQSVNSNLKNLKGDESQWRDPLLYEDTMYERLKVKFSGAKNIKKNYSQIYQDMFVLTMLNGKTDGRWFEIGCGHPWHSNNTLLLEEVGWTGVSIDFLKENTDKWGVRKTVPILADALKLDYEELMDGDYDYLQIDIEPALNTFNVLMMIPFETHRFAVITFEHDYYYSPEFRERSRAYLRSHGYVLVASDIAADRYNSFEDWWCHPDLVDAGIIERVQNTSGVKRADLYMLENL
jgi:SAM-dependent methyltransferase